VTCTKNAFSDPEYVDNGDYVPVTGAQYYINGTLSFPKWVAKKVDTFYRTYYGYGVAHSGETWCRCDDCLSIALHRNTGSRKPEIPGFEESCRAAQREFVGRNRHIILPYLQSIFEEALREVPDPIRLVNDEHDLPHPKKQLRIQAFLELLHLGLLTSWNWMRRNPEVKLKTEEIAKPGKKGRTIADLGVEASLRGAFIVERIKTVMARRPLILNGTVIRFVKTPNPDVLEEVFKELITPDGSRRYTYHSDDSCYSGPNGYGNADISNCDGSHTNVLFDLLIDATPRALRPEMEELVAQCASRVTVRSVADPTAKVILQPTHPKLLSGSTLTTLVNNVANILIGIAYSQDRDADVVRAPERRLRRDRRRG